jgi:uncharacterized protein YxeA
MKKVLIILGLLAILSVLVFGIQQIASAITLGSEPPVQFINNVKSCTKSTFSTKNMSAITEYNIKGLNSEERCEFSITTTYDFTNKDNYDAAMNVLSGFRNMAKSMAEQSGQKWDNPDLPSQKEFVEMMKNEKEITVCKLSQRERNDLYSAYQKHDGKNPPPVVTKDSYSFSFDSSKISSYDQLMMTYSSGPCRQLENNKTPKQTEKRYSCEYKDTTCYYTKYFENGKPSGVTTMKCTVEKGDSFKLMDVVKGHVDSGMCEEL